MEEAGQYKEVCVRVWEHKPERQAQSAVAEGAKGAGVVRKKGCRRLLLKPRLTHHSCRTSARSLRDRYSNCITPYELCPHAPVAARRGGGADSTGGRSQPAWQRLGRHAMSQRQGHSGPVYRERITDRAPRAMNRMIQRERDLETRMILRSGGPSVGAGVVGLIQQFARIAVWSFKCYTSHQAGCSAKDGSPPGIQIWPVRSLQLACAISVSRPLMYLLEIRPLFRSSYET